MARSKIDFKPYPAFLYPNRFGHRNEIKAAIFISSLIIIKGISNYFYWSNKPINTTNYLNDLSIY